MNNQDEIALYNIIKNAIKQIKVKVVSFDIFDTLLVRPTCSPTDLFYLVENRIKCNKNLPDIPFKDVRITAEKIARNELKLKFPFYEDITIDEIYEKISEIYDIDHDTCNQFKNLEIEVELKYLTSRSYIKSLYDLALNCGKKIVALSDVYLPATVIIKALKQNGYSHIDRYFISSETRLTKASGNLYTHVLNELNLQKYEIIHIGDNFLADFKKAKQSKIEAFHIPKRYEHMLKNRIDWSLWRDRIDVAEPSYRLLEGLIQNEIFDTLPQEGWNKDSLFNGSPYILGYYGVGPFLLALGLWLIRDACKKRYDILGFIARDGYLPNIVYEMLRPYYPNAPQSLYFRISRSVCYPFYAHNKASLMHSDKELYFERTLSSRKILENRLFCSIDGEFENFLIKQGIDLEAPCHNFYNLMKAAADYGLEAFKGLEQHRKFATEYYHKIFDRYDKIALFDCGYSGRTQRILADMLNQELDAYYIASFESIHSLDDTKLSYYNFLCEPFNRWIKNSNFITFLLEIFISENTTGSIIGFNNIENEIQPVFESSELLSDADKHVIDNIQHGALDFIRVALATFGSDIRFLQITPATATRVLSQFMTNPHPIDARIFDQMNFTNGITGEAGPIIGTTEKESKWKEGFHALHSKSKKFLPSTLPSWSKVEITGKKVYYNGREISARISSMRVIPRDDFIEAVSLMASGTVDFELKIRCRQIVRERSKWLAAATLLKHSGGVWSSQLCWTDKLYAQIRLWLRR